MKFILIPFFLCAMFVGCGIRSWLDDSSGHALANNWQDVLIPTVIACGIYAAIRSSAAKARAAGTEKIAAWSTSAWMLAPPLTFLAGIPAGIYYIEVAQYLSRNHG